MGVGLGIGLLLGVRSSVAEMLLSALLLLAGLLLLAPLARGHLRVVLLLVAAGIAVGWGVAQLRATETSPPVIPVITESLTGVIVSDPDASASGSRAWIRSDELNGNVSVYLPAGSVAARGDMVEVTGRLNPESVAPQMYASSAVVVRRAGWLEIQRRSIRDYATSTMVSFVPGAAGSLTLGLLIGDDSGLPNDERVALRESGLSHITAVSGWNVSVVVASVGALFYAIGARSWRWLPVQLGFLAGYVWIVGLEPPIQRAAIMGAVALVALQFGRPAHMLTLLTLTAGLMATWNPSNFDSLSFLLSFLSMIGLVVAARVTDGLTGWKSVAISPAVAATAAGLLTAPLLAATFGTLSLMTIPANLLAGPLIPLATFAGVGVVATSWLSPAAEAVGWLGWLLSSVVLGVSRLFASVPGAHHEFSPLTPSVAVTIYFGLALVMWPLFPEGRLIAHRFENWYRTTPQGAVAGALVALGMLGVGVVLT